MVKKTSPLSTQTNTGSKSSGCCLFAIPIAIFVGVVNLISIPIKYFLSPANHKYARPLAVISLFLFGWLWIGLSSIFGQPTTNITPPPTQDTNAISTHALETAIAAYKETLAASSSTPTAESTSTFLPTATEPIATDTQIPVAIPVTGAFCIPNNPPQTGRVVQVVDGDTIKVILDEDGLTYSIRYIGMDTPENTSQNEYFGLEATSKNEELVSGKSVTLIKDVSETDPYGRLLRYVLVDEIFVNYELVAQGFANTASYPPDISCIPTFQAAEEQALVSKFGFWAAPPTLAVIPTAVLSGGDSGGDAPCNCGGPDLDCGNFGSHASAQACYNYCSSSGYGDVFRLDRDGDGSACEDLP